MIRKLLGAIIPRGVIGRQILVLQVIQDRQKQEQHIDIMYSDVLNVETETPIELRVIIVKLQNILSGKTCGIQQRAIQ